MKWKNIPNDNNNIKFDPNFFDSCLSLNEKNKDTLKDNNININSLSDNNSINENPIIYYSNKKNNLDNNNIIFSTDKKSNYTSNNKIPENSLDFDENLYPKYNETNNNSIILDNDILFIKRNTINEFEIKEIKENSKIKCDIFNSKDINNSLNLQKEDLNNIDDKIINEKGKERDLLIGEKEIKFDLNLDINKNNNIEINEMCNINVGKEEIKTNNLINKEDNYNDKMIEEKNKIINKKEMIKINSNISRNENIFKEKNNSNLKYINKANNENKDNLFDSLENSDFKTTVVDRYSKTKKEKIKNLENIQINKIKILNQFLTIDKSTIHLKKNNFNTPKKNNFQISETNNIFLNKKDIEKKSDSSKCINKEKVENIFIKGEPSINKKMQYSSENKTKKNLELFINEENDNIFITYNSNKNGKQNISNQFNNILENNIQKRLIDSKMIINFLNNSRNEPMFPPKNSSTIQIPHSNENKNINYNTLKNVSHERKNHFYLKKTISNRVDDNKNIINGINDNIDNLIINENELIEPDVQICPVSHCNINDNKQEMNGIYEKLYNGNIIKDILKNRKRNDFFENNWKSKNLSFDSIHNKKLNKFKNYAQNGKIKKKNHSISSELIDFINSSKKEKDNKDSKKHGEIYNFKTIKYNKFNTYRLNLNKNKINNRINCKNNKLDINQTFLNKNKKKNETNKSNLSLRNNNKRNVDYNRLNELYLDYKCKSIKRNQLKKEQDIKRGITFMPILNNNIIKKNKIN